MWTLMTPRISRWDFSALRASMPRGGNDSETSNHLESQDSPG
jgi:hypothetical protein